MRKQRQRQGGACVFQYFCHTFTMAKKENGRRKHVVSEWSVGQPLSFPAKAEEIEATASQNRKTKQPAKDKRK
jgi:hypothetical protein